MPITDDGFDPRDADQLTETQIQALESLFDDPATNEGDLIRALIESNSRTTAQNQEADMAELYENMFLATATDKELTKKAAEIGVYRQPATKATAVVEFRRDSPAPSNYVIDTGTFVETNEDNPKTFQTTESVTLKHYDGFDDNDIAEYSGATADFTTQSSVVHDGSYALEGTAVAGSAIVHNNKTVQRGTWVSARTYCTASTVSQTLFEASDSSNGYVVTVDANNGQIALETLESGSISATLDSVAVTVPTTEWLEVEYFHELTNDFTVVVTDSAGNELARLTPTDDTFDGGKMGFRSGDANGSKYWDTVGAKRVTATIEATEGGVDHNVGQHRIVVLPAAVKGVQSVTNPYPSGDNDYVDTSNTAFVVGNDREDDEALRSRAEQSKSIGGAATVNAIDTKLREASQDIKSVTVFENSDSTADGAGLSAYSLEPVIYGGTDKVKAQALFEVVTVTELGRTEGGNYGTAQSYTISDDILGKDITVSWSEPSEKQIDITLDIVIEDTYVGNDEIRDRIVSYIGGVDPTGTNVDGTSVGEPVYIDQVEDEIVSADTGVVGISSATYDTNGDGTDDTTTDSNGLTIIDVADNVVAATNGSDGSISITTTQI